MSLYISCSHSLQTDNTNARVRLMELDGHDIIRAAVSGFADSVSISHFGGNLCDFTVNIS